MLKLILFVASLPLIPLALAHGPEPQAPTPAKGPGIEPVRCEIRVTPMPGGVRLEGAVLAKRKLAGSYAFKVEKRGRAGSSSSSQSGDFAAAAGRAEVVGEVGLGLERGASYRAELKVRWPGGETVCVKTDPSRV